MNSNRPELPSGVILAIDWGQRRVGLAVSDSTQAMVFPIKVLQRSGHQPEAAAIRKTVQENGARAIIVGWPLLNNGLSGQNGPVILKWVESVCVPAGVPIFFADERFTSVLADETLRETGRKASQRKALIDSMAAREFLQDVINGAARIWPLGSSPPEIKLA